MNPTPGVIVLDLRPMWAALRRMSLAVAGVHRRRHISTGYAPRLGPGTDV